VFLLPLLDFLIFDKKGEKIFMCFDFTLNPLLMIDKKGEKYLWVICMFSLLKGEKYLSFLTHYAYILYFAIRSKRFDLWFDFCYDCISYIAYMSWAFIAISIIYCHAWVKGELLWSFTLIHAYITPWVLSSSKRGRLLAQRPITLVLMMINSCSYSY